MIQTSDGGIALSATGTGNPVIIIKLNPCFELEWSRAISIPTGIMFKTDIHELGDNSLLTMVGIYNYEHQEATTLFYNLKNNGELNWSDTLPKNSYCMPDPFGSEFILTADSNYLINCGYNSAVSLIKPMSN
ncbi:MAG: hypothetical protein IPH45_03975 [Bacteroidales bacterium]|nr:hypothetical protein [Bacteroidales bacterium]